LVKIELVEDSGSYGHYPFQMVVVNKNDGVELNSLMYGGNISACILRIKECLQAGAKKILISLDFPKALDLINDHVVVLEIAGERITGTAITYSTETGKILERIEKSDRMDGIIHKISCELF